MKVDTFKLLNNFFDHKWKIIFVFTIISFLLSFLFFEKRDLMSEYLVVNTLFLNDINSFQHWLGIFFYDGQQYISQFGIQGFIFSIPIFIGIEPSSIYLLVLILFVSFLFYYLIVSSAIEIKLQYNSISALLFLLIVFFNPLFLFNSGNLYWLYFIYILPFYFSLKYYNKINNKLFYLLLSLIFLLKFLTNFEYSSTFVMSATIPIILKLNFNFFIGLKKILKELFLVFISSVFSFTIAIILMISQLSYNGQKPILEVNKIIASYSAGADNKPHFLNYINKRVEWNTMYNPIFNNIDNPNQKNGWDGVIKARESYAGYKSIFKYVNFNTNRSIFYSLQFIFFCALSLLLLIYYLTRIKTKKASLIILLLAILSSLSWVLLMPLHFYLHSVYWSGISDVILILPLYTTILILLGIELNIYLKPINLLKK